MIPMKRPYIIMSSILLIFIAAAIYGGFTSIPILQNPRIISNYTPDSYKDQVIIESSPDEGTWIAWLSDIDSQNCRIYSYKWKTQNSGIVYTYDLEDEIDRWRLWQVDELDGCFEHGEGGPPNYWNEDQLGIVDIKSCVAPDPNDNDDLHVYVAVVVDIFAYTIEEHDPVGHVSFIDVFDVTTRQMVDCSGCVLSDATVQTPANGTSPLGIPSGLFIHQYPSGRPVECCAIAPAEGGEEEGPEGESLLQLWSFWIVNEWDDQDPGWTTDRLYYKQHGVQWANYSGTPFGSSYRVPNHLDATPDPSDANGEQVCSICEGSSSNSGTVSLIRCNPSEDDFDATELDSGTNNLDESPQMAIGANMNWSSGSSIAYACWRRKNDTLQARRINQSGIGSMTQIAQCATYPYPDVSYYYTNDGLITYKGKVPADPTTGYGLYKGSSYLILAWWQSNNAIDYVPISDCTGQYPDYSLSAHHLRVATRRQANSRELYCAWMGQNSSLDRVFGKHTVNPAFDQDTISCSTAHRYEDETFYTGGDWSLARVKTGTEVTSPRDSILEFVSEGVIPARSQVYRSNMNIYIDENERAQGINYPVYGYLVKYPRTPRQQFESGRYVAAAWDDDVGSREVIDDENYELTNAYNYFTKRPGGYDYFYLTFFTGQSDPWGNPAANYTYFRVNKNQQYHPEIDVRYIQWSNN
jgi:hypothetical protein